jgi:predicted RNase H-like nuclease
MGQIINVNYVGVDGCRLGWIAVALDSEANWRTRTFPTIAELWAYYNSAALILIDMPIGFRDSGTDERSCDLEARRLLAARHSSVFPVPCRAAVYADPLTKASQINMNNTGRLLSRQTLNIILKIRQLDRLLLSNATAAAHIREVHPEVCFWALNGLRPMTHNKKKVPGFEERMQVLRSDYCGTDALVNHALSEYRRNGVDRDDILDALVAALTAFNGQKGLEAIPKVPEHDSSGLPMEMVYVPPPFPIDFRHIQEVQA